MDGNTTFGHGRRGQVLLHLSLLLTVAIWGMTFVAVKYMAEHTGAPGVLLFRSGVATVGFVVVLGIATRRLPRFPAVIWRRLAVLALLGVIVNNVALAYGLSYVSAALASLIASSTPVFATLMSRVLLGEPLTRRKLGGITVAFFGFLIVLLWGSGYASFSAENAFGVLILTSAPLSLATYTVLSKPLLREYEPHVIAGTSIILGGLMLTPYLLWHAEVAADVLALSWRGWLAGLTMSLLAICFAYILWNRGLQQLEPTRVAVYMYLTPVFGVVAAYLLLDEAITRYLVLGGATILAGVVLTNSGGYSPPHQQDIPNPSPRIATGEDVQATRGEVTRAD